MRFSHLLSPVILVFILSIPAFAQPEPSHTPLLIAKPNPALADVNRLMVVFIPTPSEPNTGGLVWSQLTETISSKLDAAGIKIVGAVAGNILEIPELRLNVDILKCVNLQQYVFRVQTSFARKVLLENGPEVYIKADVFQTDPVMQLVQTHGMPDAIISAACQQVDTFIAIWSVAKQIDTRPNTSQSRHRLQRSVEPRDTNTAKEQAEYKFVASKNSEVFHRADCPSAQKIKPQNLVSYNSREEAVNAGKRPCKRCNP